MFATLLGGLPRPTGSDGSPIANDDAAVVAVLGAQAEAGLEPLTDGRLRTRGIWAAPRTVDAWRFAAEHAGGLVKQALPGPFTLARRLGAGDRDAVLDIASAIRADMRALADAGCTFIEIEERDGHLIGTDPAQRELFASAHRLLLDGLEGVHVSLAITGGSADGAGIETILAAPYRSLAVDLVDGPDNWHLVRAAPGDRGIVCGAVSSSPTSDDGPEILIWAAAYAASANDRGPDRVGLATAGGLEGLPWATAVRKMQRLGAAAALAARPRDEIAAQLDPRAIDIRSAGLGRYDPPELRPPRRGRSR